MTAVDAGAIATILAGLAPVGFHAPWRRFDVDAEAWTAIAKSLGNGAGTCSDFGVMSAPSIWRCARPLPIRA